MLIGKPKTKAEIDGLIWQLYFKEVSVYIRHFKWYLMIESKCMYLDDNNLCIQYDKRPWRCKKHIPKECEYYGKWYDTLLNTPDDLKAYFRK